MLEDSTTVLTLANILLNAFGLAALLTLSYAFGSKLSRMEAKQDQLSQLPVKVEILEKDMVGVKADLNALWDAFRNYCEHQDAKREEDLTHEAQRLENIMLRLEKKRMEGEK